METANKNLVIDADAHVVECARTWEFMDPSEQRYRPIPLEAREEAGVKLQFWVIDGKVKGFRFPAFSAAELAQGVYQLAREGADALFGSSFGVLGDLAHESGAHHDGVRKAR